MFEYFNFVRDVVDFWGFDRVSMSCVFFLIDNNVKFICILKNSNLSLEIIDVYLWYKEILCWLGYKIV